MNIQLKYTQLKAAFVNKIVYYLKKANYKNYAAKIF